MFETYDSTFFLIIGIACLIALVPAIFFILTLQKTLTTISPENRKMQPGQVWLMLIPLFNLVWQFIVVDRISDSIAAECRRLNIPLSEKRPSYNIGLAYCILTIAGALIPFISLGGLVTWIVYWVKVAEYNKLMIDNQSNFMLDAERNVFHNT